ncbi:TPA: CaiF/GrlA family transcriptional regulator [Salmonella enterica subsp. enterica serovar Muenchen]|uniref:CaiF/GrlA family transcriptional regulator n=1 Tax=Salmonella enterica subsp. enterica serovar Eastbourne TaxID=486993 RepID=A0A702F991_SALET|nr:CaiF/GrlA family transcriptional regulator [Salmonella enterica subsp. enterica serovar Eastbourne]EDQ3858065.1 CaiF/GrlA family transcriptional regulator [Salmonella enterica subsp. diarizonae]EGB7051579.1 CaiF/GrlA family transcriptional regulator [Salmonella enterica]HEB6532455.1 CaiF/GrlA family transcriptional regulator [Salmonella enterica subsp. enterica serovar Havana]HEC7515131.1 CaiF/GrlA family transcriptional regulator [Salmonella enterica subsp. enterica serovar Muenchen]
MTEKKNWRTPYQRNHDAFVVPSGLEAWADRPLYILVAQWCLRHGGWVSRRDIAQAFGISERGATYQLTYLARKKTQVKCEQRKVRRAGMPVARYEVRVLSVMDESVERKVTEKQRSALRTTQTRRVGNADEGVRAQMRDIWNSLQRGRKS